MSKPKNVQIPLETFLDLVKVHLGGIDDKDTLERISTALEGKLDALAKREIFSQYKDKTLPPEEREQAWQDYLDVKHGI